jgi:hypothetical protein
MGGRDRVVPAVQTRNSHTCERLLARHLCPATDKVSCDRRNAAARVWQFVPGIPLSRVFHKTHSHRPRFIREPGRSVDLWKTLTALFYTKGDVMHTLCQLRYPP